jgi:hypothetical protein
VCARSAEPALRAAVRSNAAQQLRAARFDLIYFWEVGTDSTNHFLPFLRPAPVQCTGWGWPDTARRRRRLGARARLISREPRTPSPSTQRRLPFRRQNGLTNALVDVYPS